MIWIGHNNLDWVHGLSKEEREHPAMRLQAIATQFRISYTESLQSLIEHAKTENHKVLIVVFGLANIDAYLREGGRRKSCMQRIRSSILILTAGPAVSSL